jgi:hypothetical protein
LALVIYSLHRGQDDVHDHRVRNEQLHEAVCHRQDELAKALGITLEVRCPAPVPFGQGLEGR